MCCNCEILLLLIYVHVCDECVLNVWTVIRVYILWRKHLRSHRHTCKNQISSTCISTSASKLYIYVFEIQKFWRHLKQFELLIGSLSFRQPIHLWQYKPVKGLLRFSLFKYLGRRVCVLTRRQHPPPPLLEKISFFICSIWTSKNLLSSRVLAIPHHLSRSAMFLANRALGACLQPAYVHVPYTCQATLWIGHLIGKLFCFATELISSDVECPSRSRQ